MIEAKDLRIGNWVKHNDIVSSSEYPDTIFQWTESHWHDIVTSHLSLNSIDPIPLTPDILLACGFEKSNSSDYWHMSANDYSFYEGAFPIAEKNNKFYPLFACEDDFYSWVGKEIQFLHQLQNFIFSNTNTELSYNPIN